MKSVADEDKVPTWVSNQASASQCMSKVGHIIGYGSHGNNVHVKRYETFFFVCSPMKVIRPLLFWDAMWRDHDVIPWEDHAMSDMIIWTRLKKSNCSGSKKRRKDDLGMYIDQSSFISSEDAEGQNRNPNKN